MTDLTALGLPPMVASRADGTGLFVLRYRGIVQVMLVFEDYADALQGYLEEGAAVQKLGAVGEFDDASAVLTADVIEIDLQ